MKEKRLENLFWKYIHETLSYDEKIDFYQLVEDPELEETLHALIAKHWSQHNSKTIPEIDEISQRLIQNVTDTITAKPERHRSIKRLWPWIAVASCVLLFFITRQLIPFLTQERVVEPSYQTIVASNGEKKKLVLPDESVVYLNGGSKLMVPGDFSKSDREVILDGEAFFEVSKNPERPFRVLAGILSIQVVGTAFNVHAYEPNSDMRVSVASGAVQVGYQSSEAAGDVRPVVLTKGQQLVAAPGEPFIVKNLASVHPDLSWRKGLLVLDNNSFMEVASILERWYNVQIDLEIKSPEKCRLTGNFEQMSVTDVLNILKLTVDFDYEKTGNHIRIYGDGCD